MIPKQLSRFMSQVSKATNDGQIAWGEGAENAFIAAHKDANMHLRRYMDPETGDEGFVFTISRNGKRAFFSVVNGEDDFNDMSNLFAAASVSAAGDGFTDGLFE